MEVTEEMIQRAQRWWGEHAEYKACRHALLYSYAESILRVALADIPEPVQGPLVLSGSEADAKRFVEGCSGSKGPLATTGNVLAAALDRAQRTLAAPAIEPLSEALRREAEWAVGDGAIDLKPGSVRIAAELLRRCPKPEPKPRTAEELARDVSDHIDWATHFDSPSLRKSFDELVALAKANK